MFARLSAFLRRRPWPPQLVGDGVTDNTSAMRWLIDHAGNGAVHLPPGVYAVKGLRIRKGIRLDGDGPGTTKITGFQL
jgi:hypothetical protein